MTGMNNSDVVNALSNLMVIDSSDENFASIYPRAVDYAEQRIYRELDLLYTQYATSAAMTAANRSMAIPTTQHNMIVLQSMNAVTPASTAPDAGTRVPLQRVSLEFLNSVWPTAAADSNNPVPQYYAMIDNATVWFAPTPYAAYYAEFIGTFRPTPLSATNTVTFLSEYLPDLLIAAMMVFYSGWSRDFSSIGEDPSQGTSWEQQYQMLSKSAYVEEARRKAQSSAWQPYSPAPLATPPRQ